MPPDPICPICAFPIVEADKHLIVGGAPFGLKHMVKIHSECEDDISYNPNIAKPRHLHIVRGEEE